MRTKTCTMIACLASVTLTACGTTSRDLIVDGPRAYNFEADLAACQALSREVRPNHLKTAGGAIIGGLVGAAESDDGNEGEDALVGAAIGGAIGGAAAGIDVAKKRREIVKNCMRGRGHRIVN